VFDVTRAVAVLLAAFLMIPPAWASPPSAATQNEISHLLSYLGASGCDFYRNGSWHDATEARSHLQRKLDYLVKHSLVTSTEDFIARGASSSSMSGEEYLVRCPGSEPVKSRAWLTGELQRYRSANR
jgi:hypothetical protein